ncbi:MAG TPA: PstS family phosphate ABC transporter substrate-binding protein [Dehalococcoidia bacterium]|nr:PstS family phosphate ABC transporter substrate-binding protein [Dehalococcoidia bacterium]
MLGTTQTLRETWRAAAWLSTAALLLTLAIACAPSGAPNAQTPAAVGTPTPALSGAVRIDGSSTVFPVTEAVAEEFQKLHRRVQVTVGISGTGGGFQKFCNKETDISDASRPISASERDACQKNGRDYIELPVAYDGLSVIVNPQNTWVTSMTTADLKKIWEPDAQGKVTRWSQVRPEWPDRPLTLYGPGTDSGTFDYFTEVINGRAKASRGDFTASEDDNVLVQGIAGDANALGYFGYAYYVENKGRLKLVAIDGGRGPVLPTEQTINDGTYAPLSRPIFIYVAKDAADRREVQEFVKFYLNQGRPLVAEVGYVRVPDRVYDAALQRFERRVVGSVYTNAPAGAKLEDLFK